MDTIKFSDYTKAPFRTEDAAMLQEMTSLVAEALTGSNNASLIMKGCELSGNVISAGIVCIGGEIMRADAGLKNANGETKYIVVETKETVVSQTTTYTDYVISKKAVIDNLNGNFIWDTARRNQLPASLGYVYEITTKDPGNNDHVLNFELKNDLLSITGRFFGSLTNKTIPFLSEKYGIVYFDCFVNNETKKYSINAGSINDVDGEHVGSVASVHCLIPF